MPDLRGIHSWRSLHLATLTLAASGWCAFALSPGCDSRPAQTSSAPAASSPASMPAGLDRTIRALLVDDVSSCELILDGPVEILETASRRPLLRVDSIARLSCRFDASGIVMQELDRSMPYRRVDLVPRGGKTLQVVRPKGVRRYPGVLRLVQRGPSTGALVNVVDIEQYLVGVVAAEIPGGFQAQAFAAQAIVARTYAWYARQTGRPGRDWDLYSTESSQMYIGMPHSGMLGGAQKAVRDTAGLVCTWTAPEGERIFCAYYSSTCGGSTQPAGSARNEPPIGPLTGNVRCEWCRASPDYRWEPVRVSKQRITDALRARYERFGTIGPIDHVEVIEKTPGGRPLRLGFYDFEGRGLELDAENFRLAVDPTGREIKSTYFVPVDEPDTILLTEGRGFGHGMGMCQYGADALARAGRTAPEILRFYYPGSHLTRAY